jgi:hypothetical protein
MALPDNIRDIVNQKVDRLESVPNAFLSAMERIQRNKFREVASLIDVLDYSGGNLVVNEANLLRIEGIVEGLKDVLTGQEFESAVASLMDEFDEQAVLNFAYFEEIEPAFSIPEIATATVKQRQAATIADLLDSTNQYLSNPTRSALSDAIQSGVSRQDLIDTLRIIVQGDDQIDGRLLRSTRLIVSDAFALNDAAVSEVIAQDLGLEWYLYTGGLMDSTRPFCKARNGKYFHRTEVESWANLTWNGKMPNTDSKTIFLTRGGYNCQHSLLPVSESIVPKKDVQRVFANA